jgi:glycerol kinase
MTRATGRNQIVRAALESIAYQTNDILALMHEETGIPITNLNVDGGASANNLLMQMQADFSQLTVRRPAVRESTALGAAYLAGLSTGFWTNEDLEKTAETDRIFTPELSDDARNAALSGWRRALRAVKAWSSFDETEEG